MYIRPAYVFTIQNSHGWPFIGGDMLGMWARKCLLSSTSATWISVREFW